MDDDGGDILPFTCTCFNSYQHEKGRMNEKFMQAKCKVENQSLCNVSEEQNNSVSLKNYQSTKRDICV